MDDRSFDQFSRGFGKLTTRRQALKAVVGAMVGIVAGSRAAAAQTCTPQYSPCGGDGECCAGSVCEYGLCMPGCRIDGAFYSPWSMPPGEVCRQCTPELSTTSWSPANDGMSCWSGDPTAGVTTCQNGVCTGQAAQSCPPPTPCHLEGEVDPVTGMCVNPPAPEGTPCGIDAMCHGGFYQPADMCDGNGFCIGGGSRVVSCFPYECTADGCLTTCASHDDCSAGGYVCRGGSCVQSTSTEYPLFNCGPGYACPTGATTFDPGGPLDPTSSDQARAACEACFGIGNCVFRNYPAGDCAGDAWAGGWNAGIPSFGFEASYCGAYPQMPAGRVFTYGFSHPENDYGYWGLEVCPEATIQSMAVEEEQPSTLLP